MYIDGIGFPSRVSIPVIYTFANSQRRASTKRKPVTYWRRAMRFIK